METAKIFENGRSQAVRLPKKFRFNTDEVIYGWVGRLYQRCFCGWKRSRCSERERKSVTYMLDTNICIYAMKNKPENVLQRLKKELNSGVCISSITLAELEYGMKHSSNPAKNEQALLRFLIPLSILPFGAVAATEYGAIRTYLQNNGTPIGPLDMLIAAHAKSENMILVTNNVREFERVPELEIENWAE